MIFIEYLIVAFFSFFCFLLSIFIFDNKIDNKISKSAILSVLTFTVGLITRQLGGIGLFAGLIINFILLMKILGYNFFSALIFTIGLNLLSVAVLLGLDKVFG